MNREVKRNRKGNAARLSCMLFGGVSVMALGLAMPAWAQDSQDMETVVVTGQRAAIEKASQIKENADQIVDSIVADDAGKLPDRSITEVLQRVSGVTITHFNDPGTPDNYTVEGSGPAVRGLPGGTSLLNGHNAFSANGGRNILWSDVPSELMKAVDVLKSYTPDQVEGGLGGTINLRTYLPFDFDGTKFGGRVGVSYGDLVKQGRPVGSAMVSTRWDTKWGEMGLLVDLSYDDDSYRNDSIQTEPYYPHTNVIDNYVLDNSSPPKAVLIANPTTYYLPGGFDYHTAFGYHQRGGGNVAFQWRPNDKLLFHARAFTSVNETDTYENYYAAQAGGQWGNITYTPDPSSGSGSNQGAAELLGALSGPTPTPTDPLYHIFDSANYLLKSNTYLNPQNISACVLPDKQCSSAATRASASRQFTRTSDIEVGADWEPNDRWLVLASADFIYGKASYKNLNVEGDAVMPAYGVDLSGTYPTFHFTDPSVLRTSSNYYWNDTMEDRQKNYGQEMQANVDVIYHLNYGMIKDVRFGVRGDVRAEYDHDTGYNWQALSPSWTSPQYYWSSPDAIKDTVLYQFPNFFRGETNLPGPALFVDPSKVGMLDDAYFQNQYNTSHLPPYITDHNDPNYNGHTLYATKPFNPYDAKHYNTVNVAGYAMVTFAKDNVLGMAMSGNAGARLVYVDNQASGYWGAWGNSLFRFTPDGPLYATVAANTVTGDGFVPVSGGKVSWTLLPAFNVKFMPTDQIQIRLAGSITAQQPNFAGISGGYSVSTQTATNSANQTVNVVSGFNFSGDNPRLKPQIGRNFDMSFEWYGDGGANAHVSLFYKSIKHMTTKTMSVQNVSWILGVPDNDGSSCINQVNYQCVFPNGVSTFVEPTVVQGYVNSNKEAIVRGVEVGFTKYFDWGFVPSYLKGFGFSGNYTYIDSRAPGNFSFDMYGNNIGSHLPMEGLSHHSANAQFMYDREPISFRLAYNWRSKYLMLASGWNTSSTENGGLGYVGSDNGITCHQNNNAAGGWGGNVQEGYCYYALPVWSKAFGSLDAGMDYSIDDHWRLSIQSQNLLNTKAKTTMGINLPAYTDATGVARPAQRETARNWFVADRRVSIDLRVNF